MDVIEKHDHAMVTAEIDRITHLIETDAAFLEALVENPVAALKAAGIEAEATTAVDGRSLSEIVTDLPAPVIGDTLKAYAHLLANASGDERYSTMPEASLGIWRKGAMTAYAVVNVALWSEGVAVTVVAAVAAIPGSAPIDPDNKSLVKTLATIRSTEDVIDRATKDLRMQGRSGERVATYLRRQAMENPAISRLLTDEGLEERVTEFSHGSENFRLTTRLGSDFVEIVDLVAA